MLKKSQINEYSDTLSSMLPAISVKVLTPHKCARFHGSEVFIRYRGWAGSATVTLHSDPSQYRRTYMRQKIPVSNCKDLALERSSRSTESSSMVNKSERISLSSSPIDAGKEGCNAHANDQERPWQTAD